MYHQELIPLDGIHHQKSINVRCMGNLKTTIKKEGNNMIENNNEVKEPTTTMDELKVAVLSNLDGYSSHSKHYRRLNPTEQEMIWNHIKYDLCEKLNQYLDNYCDEHSEGMVWFMESGELDFNIDGSVSPRTNPNG